MTIDHKVEACTLYTFTGIRSDNSLYLCKQLRSQRQCQGMRSANQAVSYMAADLVWQNAIARIAAQLAKHHVTVFK